MKSLGRSGGVDSFASQPVCRFGPRGDQMSQGPDAAAPRRRWQIGSPFWHGYIRVRRMRTCCRSAFHLGISGSHRWILAWAVAEEHLVSTCQGSVGHSVEVVGQDRRAHREKSNRSMNSPGRWT